MKTSFLLLFLFTVPLLAADGNILSTTGTPVSAHTRNVTQAEAKVLKAYVVNDGQAVFRAYAVNWKNQEVVVSDMAAQSNLKEGDTIKFMVLKHATRRSGQEREVLSFMIMPDVKIPVVQPVPRAVQIQTKSVFFECRGNELFYVDREALAGAAGNANYAIDPAFTAVGVMRLVQKPGGHGQTVADLARADGQYRTLLAKFEAKTTTIIFFQREDSAEVFQQAQRIAEAAGFRTAAQPLPQDKPIVFGKEN